MKGYEHVSLKVEYLTVISNIGSFVGRYLIETALIVNRCITWGRVECKTLQIKLKRTAEQYHVTQESQKRFNKIKKSIHRESSSETVQ